jgi:hypothetical protein
MTERDEIRHTTQEERDRAAAVHSVPDETRVHTSADETDVVQGAGGEIRRPDEEDLGEGTPESPA